MTDSSPHVRQTRWLYWRWAAVVGIVALIADQLLKWWMLRRVFGFEGAITLQSTHPPIDITSFFALVMVWNRGVSFGMFNDAAGTWQPIGLSVLAVVIVAFLISWLKDAVSNIEALSIGMIIGGAIGNVIDRLRFGAVADFFYFYAGEFHWPAFNIADSCIVVGVMILLVTRVFFPGPAAAAADQEGVGREAPEIDLADSATENSTAQKRGDHG